MKKYLDENGLLYLVQKIKGWLSSKVDKVDGKGLSTNDYTTTEKNKLANIQAGAEANVNSDWNSSSGDSQILNKPFNSIGSGLAVTDGILSATGGGVADSVDWENVQGKPENISYFNNDSNYIPTANSEELSIVKIIHNTQSNTVQVENGKTAIYLLARQDSVPTNNNQLANGAGYQTADDVETAINNKLSSVLKYKGTVANYSDLPTDASTGDTYNITNASANNKAGDNAAWNGSDWDILSGTVDLSGYVETSDLVSITNAEIDTICA